MPKKKTTRKEAYIRIADIPDWLHERLKIKAKQNKRSIGDEIIVFLETKKY